MNSNNDITICFSADVLIDLLVSKDFPSERLHFVFCKPCLMQFCGLRLSLEQARSKDPLLTNEAFKRNRLKEIEELESMFGENSKAVDLAIRAALGGSEAIEILKSLGFKEIHCESG